MSLAAQLRVLSGHGTSSSSRTKGLPSSIAGIGGTGSGTLITPSFLFSSRQAADTDTSSIHLLSLSALHELRGADDRFAPFEATLFGSEPGTMAAFSRASQSSVVVEALDRSIGSFLRVLSPYFTLRAAHKCIEWLIRRYEIHLYNVEAVMDMALPYHDSPLFARLLQILRIDSSVGNGKWLWLASSQKNNAIVARTTLAAQCAVDRSILEFVCDLAKRAVAISREASHLKVQVGFWVVTVVEMLANNTIKIDDRLVQVLMPYITAGLKAKRWPEYQTASSMVLTQLARRVTFSVTVFDTLMTSIGAATRPEANTSVLSEWLLLVVSLFQSQTPSSLSAKLFTALLAPASVCSALANVAANYDVTLFMRLFLHQLAVNHRTNGSARKLLADIIAQVPIGNHISELINDLLDVYLADDGDKEPIRSVMSSLDARYSEAVDRALEARLDSARNSSKSEKKGSSKVARFKALTTLLSTACNGTRHQLVAGGDTTLFLALSHHQVAVRLSAIESLETLIGNGSVDASYASRTLMMRFDDDSTKVIERVLLVPGIRKIIPSVELTDRLLSLMASLAAKLPSTAHASQLMMNDPVARAAHNDSVHLLCTLMEFIAVDVFPHRVAATSSPSEAATSYLSFLLDFIIARPLTATLSRTCLQLAAKLSTRVTLFHAFDGVVASHGDALKAHDRAAGDSKEEKTKPLAMINQAIVQQLAVNVVANEELCQSLTQVIRGGRGGFTSLLALSRAVVVAGERKQKDRDSIVLAITNAIVDSVAGNDAVSAHGVASSSDMSLESFMVASFDELPSLARYALLASVGQIGIVGGVGHGASLAMVQRLFMMFSSATSPSLFDGHLAALFRRHFSNAKDALVFLNMFLVARPHSSIPLGATVRAFQLSATLISAQASNRQRIDIAAIVPAVLVGLSHGSKAVRYGALEALHALTTAITNGQGDSSDTAVLALLTSLNGSRHELLADHTFVRTRCTSLLSHSSDTSSLTVSQRDAALRFLYPHASSGIAAYAHNAILSMLRDVTSPIILQLVLPVLEQYLTISSSSLSDDTRDIVHVVSLLVSRYDEVSLTATPSSARGLIAALRCKLTHVDEQSRVVSVRATAAEQVKHVFTCFAADDQAIVFDLLLSMTTDDDELVVLASQATLKSVRLSSSLLIARLVTESYASLLSKAAPVLEVLQYKSKRLDDKFTLIPVLFKVLRSLQQSSFASYDIEYEKQLVLSALLPLVRKYVEEVGVVTEKKSKTSVKGALTIGDIDVSSVVTCIIGASQRNGDTSTVRSGAAASATIDSTRNRALVLLSSIANMAPSCVVDHLVPVFTHLATLNSAAAGGALRTVGGVSGVTASSSLSMDDTYTDSLIQQTIETVIPSVAANMTSANGVHDLLRSFIFAAVSVNNGKTTTSTFAALDARRLRLLTSLVATLSTPSSSSSSGSDVEGNATHLHGAIELLLAQGVIRASQPVSAASRAMDEAADIAAAQAAAGKKKKNKKKVVRAMESISSGNVSELSAAEFCHQLTAAFSPLQQIRALVSLLTVFDGSSSASSGESKREKKSASSSSSSYLSADTVASSKQRWEWQCEALSFVGAHLTQVPLLRKLLDLEPSEEATVQDAYLELFQSLFARLRSLSQQLHAAHTSSSSDATSSISLLQPLIARSRTALDNLTGLLSPRAFVAVTRSLLAADDAPIRQAALTLLSDKVGQQPEDLTDDDTKLYLQLLPSLERLLKEDKATTSSSSSTATDDSLTSKQATLLAVDALVRAIGGRDESRAGVLAILPAVQSCAEHSNHAVATSSLIALESMVTALGLHVLPHLPKLFPLAMNVLDRALSGDIASTSSAVVTKGKRKADEPVAVVVTPVVRVAGIEQLQVAALAAISSMVEQLPQYLSPYLGRLLELLLHPSFAPVVITPVASMEEAVAEVKKGEHSDAMLATIARTLATLGHRVEARLLVPQLLAVFPKALSYGASSLIRLFGQVSSLCSTLPATAIIEQYSNIVRLLLLGLDVRRLHGVNHGASIARLATQADSIEDSVIDAFMALSLKTDEKQFKTMFMKTLQWLQSSSLMAASSSSATNGDSKDEARGVEKLGQSSDDIARALTFFRLVDRLITRLKSLFVRYFGYLLEPCVTLLRAGEEVVETENGESSAAGNKRRRKDRSGSSRSVDDAVLVSQQVVWRNQLTTTIVESLGKCFAADNDGFMGKEQFDVVMPPLVDLLETGASVRSADAYTIFIDRSLVPSLAALASAMKHHMLWKPLNHALMMKTRSSLAPVRLSSLKVLSELFTRLQQQYLVLLPETLPFISELMEDQDSQVEEMTQRVIKQIEDLSGENLENHLK